MSGMTEWRRQMESKFDNIMSGHKVNQDDRDWLRALLEDRLRESQPKDGEGQAVAFGHVYRVVVDADHASAMAAWDQRSVVFNIGPAPHEGVFGHIQSLNLYDRPQPVAGDAVRNLADMWEKIGGRCFIDYASAAKAVRAALSTQPAQSAPALALLDALESPIPPNAKSDWWARVGDAMDSLRDALPAPSEQVAASVAVPEGLCVQLQQRCSDWGVYWRAPDAHGVHLSLKQAHELLRDALGVEVEIAAAPVAPALATREEGEVES